MDPGIVPLSCRSTGSDALLLMVVVVILQVEMAQVCLLEMVAGQQCLAQECQKVNGKKKAGQLLDVTMEARPALSLPKTTAVLLKKQLVRDACALQFHKEVLNTYYLVYL